MSTPLTNAAEYSVSEIAKAVQRTVEEEFGNVRVRGEISGFRGQHASGHAYFTLKDEAASLDAVVWKSSWPRLQFKPQEGLEVIATGRLTTFARSSKYQLVIEQIQPAGAGALMALLEERRRKLAAEGLFAAERKRRLPYLPEVIGVVTSPTGAVIRDILHRLNDRFPRHVLVWPVRVQGETSAAEVAAALRGFNALPPDGAIPRPDLLIVARGGGSIEDLWGFNDEDVVRAVAESAIPVISAVGHETDTTLVDHAADLRAPTPTAAAEAAVPVRAELIGYVDDQGHRLRQSLRGRLGNERDRVRAAAGHLPRPLDLAAMARQRLDLAATRLDAQLRHLGQRKAADLGRIAPKLSPLLLLGMVRQQAARLDGLARRADAAALRGVDRRRGAFEATAARLSAGALRAEAAQARAALDRSGARLGPLLRRGLGERAAALSALGKLLESYSYQRVLERGFALVLDEAGTILRGPDEARPGQALTVQFAEGQLGVNVAGAPARKSARREPPDSGNDQSSLF